MLVTLTLISSLLTTPGDVPVLTTPSLPADVATETVARADDKPKDDKSGKKDDTKKKITSKDLGVGKPTVPFTAKTMSGKSIKFPDDYKGKVVLLDFWATWCAPCMSEMPNVAAAYEKYHERGFDVLGISLDSKKSKENISKVEKSKGMKWPQVCDGKSWESAVAVLYNVRSIPAAYLIDGDTGNVIAMPGGGTRGPMLDAAIESALAKKEAAKKEEKKDGEKKPDAPKN